VRHQNLRWFRTTLLGRMPGWSATGAPVGPWRGLELVPAPAVRDVALTVALDGDDGVVRVRATLDHHGTVVVAVGTVEVTVHGPNVDATVRVAGGQRWWPHTHGAPHRYPVALRTDDATFELGHVGFRAIDVDRDDGAFTVLVNGERVFCRGAVWTPVDVVSLQADDAALRAALTDARDAGMNMVRLSGTMVYETDTFHDLCDELGILVWQDVMLANMDPPSDPGFVDAVGAEVRQLLTRIGHRPSLAVVCGGSEVEQQAAMLGLARDRWIMPLFDEVLPAIVADGAPGVPYVTSTPTGGTLPFHADSGVTHYYGVGAYHRPLRDARDANVRFASECLAFANVGAGAQFDDPEWKRGVPRDNGSSWDFDDVRDHYVRALFAVEPDELRATDPERAIALARVVTGELMAATFAEWRRGGARSGGGLVWLLRDLRPGAGWGVVDSDGVPKAAWWYLRRAFAPLALFAIDEGLNGLHLHVVNDGPDALDATLRVELFTRGELRTETAETAVKVAPHGGEVVVADALFDGFRDLTWSYRFGPAGHDVIAATIVGGDERVLARAIHLPLGIDRPREHDLGLDAVARRAGDGGWELAVTARRFAHAVALAVAGYQPQDNWFSIAPGATHVVALDPVGDTGAVPSGDARPLNALTGARIRVLES
jgi:beta-mannosidase